MTTPRSTPASDQATRREHDLLGERDVPTHALYGIQTLRAVENFPITGVQLWEFPTLVAAIAAVKEAAALANRDLGLLEPGRSEEAIDALEQAVASLDGALAEQTFDPTLDPVRSHPRFVALWRSMGLPPASPDWR